MLNRKDDITRFGEDEPGVALGEDVWDRKMLGEICCK